MSDPGHSILIVGLNYSPEMVGIGPYTATMAQSLAARGHRLQAVVGKPYYPRWQAWREFSGRMWQRSSESGVSVTRCAHYIPAQPSGFKRILHLASFAASALLPALKATRAPKPERPQLVICIAPALLSVPVAWLAARLMRAKLWIHIQDFEVEAACATGLINPQGPLARLASGLETRLWALADRISTISPQMCTRLAAKGVPPGRIVELRNWADANFQPDPANGAAYRKEWALGERQVALYAGNIANKQGIEILIEAARLLSTRPEIVFIICGDGPNRAQLQALAAKLGNIQIHDLQPAARMGELLALASIHLLPQIPGAADLVLPSKLTNMLASGRPVIATALPGSGLHAEVEGCGLTTPPGDPGLLAQAIATLLDDPEACARYGAEATKRASERWSREKIIGRLESEISALLGDALLPEGVGAPADRQAIKRDPAASPAQPRSGQVL